MRHGVLMEKLPQVLLKWRDHPKRASRTNLGYAPSAFQKSKPSIYAFGWKKSLPKVNESSFALEQVE